MIEWGRVPWTLWAFVISTGVGVLLTLAIAAGSTPVGPLIFLAVVMLAWDFFLLRRIRWLWIGTVVLLALTLAIELATATGTWWADLLGFGQVGLLVLPATRRFFASERSPATA